MKEYIILLDPHSDRSIGVIEALAVAADDCRRLLDGSIAIYSDRDMVEMRKWLIDYIGYERTYLICEANSVLAEGDI